MGFASSPFLVNLSGSPALSNMPSRCFHAIMQAYPVIFLRVSTHSRRLKRSPKSIGSRGAKDISYLIDVKKRNYSQSGRKFNVNRRTLARRHKGITVSQDQFHQNSQLLSPKQTRLLVDYIKNLTTEGLPPTPAMVRQFVVDMTGKYPRKNWPSEFLKRHEDECKSRYL